MMPQTRWHRTGQGPAVLRVLRMTKRRNYLSHCYFQTLWQWSADSNKPSDRAVGQKENKAKPLPQQVHLKPRQWPAEFLIPFNASASLLVTCCIWAPRRKRIPSSDITRDSDEHRHITTSRKEPSYLLSCWETSSTRSWRSPFSASAGSCWRTYRAVAAWPAISACKEETMTEWTLFTREVKNSVPAHRLVWWRSI